MNDLIERLEKATGPDRELDILIGNAVDVTADQGHLSFRRSFEICGMDEMLRQVASHNQIWHHALPRYTASIDAALTLVPDKMAASVNVDYRGGEDHSATIHYETAPSYWLGTIDADGATPAIALCIAALKARSALPSPDAK